MNCNKKLNIIIAILCGIIVLLIGIVGVGIFGKLNKISNNDEISKEDKTDSQTQADSEDTTDDDKSEMKNKNIEESEHSVENAIALQRPTILGTSEILYDESYTANADSYTIEPDLSNVKNMFQYDYISNETKEKLAKDGFVIDSDYSRDEFFEVYESNRYGLMPSFVTVDSLMHTYHIYFSHLLKTTEKEQLTEKVKNISGDMLDESVEQYGKLKGTDWEDAARKNVLFFSIANALMDDNFTIPEYVENDAIEELNKIMDASGIEISLITGDYEDYSQYKVRGYYEGDKNLEKYFRTMMWYGRIDFRQEEEPDKSALLICLAMKDTGISDWEKVYTITSFFAGGSDDLGFYEYLPVIEKCYGKIPDIEKLPDMNDEFKMFCKVIKDCEAPQINSIVIDEGEDNVIKSFRFMGQRFSIDEAIFQQLIHQNVDNRYLPDTLDVPAALGSETAYEILKDEGVTSYKNYDENLSKMKEIYNNDSSSLWNASLYSSWLYTLRPLWDEKKDGFPIFMQSNKWAKKDLECFAGSYAELKHDTVLYSKQAMAEMGGGDLDEVDDRGYVQPEVAVYARFASLAAKTKSGLIKYDALSESDAENLDKLEEIAATLLEISKKELVDEKLSDDEYEYIRCYGGYLEHIWKDALTYDMGTDYVSTQECPGAIVVDIASDPNGQVLEIATGGAQDIYVIAKVDGDIKICKGAVYDFYQFLQPLSDRMTDKEWQLKIGLIMDFDENSYSMEDKSEKVEKPDWTKDYRIESIYQRY